MSKPKAKPWAGHYTIAQSNRGGTFYAYLWSRPASDKSPQFPTPHSAKEWAESHGGLYCHDWTKA